VNRMDVTDSNAYLGRWPYWDMQVSTGELLVRHMRKNGIGAALVGSLRSVFGDAEEGNLELLRACRKHPDTLFGHATLTPFSKRKGVGIQELTSGTFKGIRLYPQYHSFPLTNSEHILETAEDLRVPVVLPLRLVMSWNLPALSMGEMVSLAREYRRINFVFSGLDYEAAEILTLKKKPTNVYIETSCLQLWGAIPRLLEEPGGDRVLLGTGTPVQYAQSGVRNVLDSTPSDGQKAMVASKSARRLFRL